MTPAANLAPGSYLLTLTGTSGSISRSGYATLVIPAPPNFTLAAAPAARTVPAGDATAYTVTVGAVNGFSGSVGLSLSGLPAGVGSAAFSPANVAGAGSSQLTVTTLATAPPGTYSAQGHRYERLAKPHRHGRAHCHRARLHGQRQPVHGHTDTWPDRVVHDHGRVGGRLRGRRVVLGDWPTGRRECDLQREPGRPTG